MNDSTTNHQRPVLEETEKSTESGYVVAQTALLLIPLMIFAAFATDIGYWYVQGQKAQRAVDAAALAGAAVLPDTPGAQAEARRVLEKNGFIDATPADNTDFLTGPLPQVEVQRPRSGVLEVKVRRQEQSFLGRIVLDGIVVERFAIAEFAAPVYLGNPSSALGTGTIPQADLGVPNDGTWLAINSACGDKEQGDQFSAMYFDGVQYFNDNHVVCGPTDGAVSANAQPNPNFNSDGFVFVVEVQPGSNPVDIDIFEPGVVCDAATNGIVTGDGFGGIQGVGTRIAYRVYGPSTTQDHRVFIDSHSPSASGLFDRSDCYSNAPGGDGWFPIASGLPNPGADGGFYYVEISSRGTGGQDLDPTDSFWAEFGPNHFSLRALETGTSSVCIFSAASPTCPQLYALEWLPLLRNIPSSESVFFLTEIPEAHAGASFLVQFFDAAEGVENIQFVDPAGNAVPFEWRYADQSLQQMTGADYFETNFQAATGTCPWNGSGAYPCLVTNNRPWWNDHLVEISIDIPPNYTCTSCWWTIRYVTNGTINASNQDRSNWAIRFFGDPVQLVE